MLPEPRRLLLGRVLEGDGPPRELAGGAQQRAGARRCPPSPPRRRSRNRGARRASAHSSQKAHTSSIVGHRRQCDSTGRPQARSCSSVAACVRGCVVGDDLVGEGPQAARGHERRVQVAQRAGGRVARVREERLPGLGALLVHPCRRRCAGGRPRRESRRARDGRGRAQRQRDRANGPDVERHVLARWRRRRAWRRAPARRSRRSARCSARRSSARRRSRAPRPRPALPSSPRRTRSSNARSSSSE